MRSSSTTVWLYTEMLHLLEASATLQLDLRCRLRCQPRRRLSCRRVSRPCRRLRRVHKSALRAARGFWRSLLRSDVAYTEIARSLARIDSAR